MTTQLHKDLRRILRSRSSGMTCSQLAEDLGRRQSTVYNALKAMPDAYISHWVTSDFVDRYVAVWKVVVTPSDAPKPCKKSS